MENAADALKMAAAILIFIIAIASSFSLFGTAKQTADSIIGMRDKQAYLESADLEGVLYTTSNSVKSDGTKFTSNGDRIVSVSDVISTIYRYSKEKYGVTIIESNGTVGTVKARFDSVTETHYVSNWNIRTNEEKEKIASLIKKNLSNDYVEVKLDGTTLGNLYMLKDQNNNTVYGENWRSNENTIREKINKDIEGTKYINNGLTYEGKGLLKELTEKKIIEITNEIDQSKYLSDTNEAGDKIETNLLQQYQMPTVEIIYIVYN